MIITGIIGYDDNNIIIAENKFIFIDTGSFTGNSLEEYPIKTHIFSTKQDLLDYVSHTYKIENPKIKNITEKYTV